MVPPIGVITEQGDLGLGFNALTQPEQEVVAPVVEATETPKKKSSKKKKSEE